MIAAQHDKARIAHIKRHIGLSVIYMILACIISACSYKWIDISKDQKYSSMVGRIYVTDIELNVYRIEIESPYKGYYIMTVDPGISARYIEKIGILPKKSLLEVTNIVKADSSDDIEYIVQILSDVPFEKMKAHIYHAGSTYIKSLNLNNIYILNSKFFSEFKNSENRMKDAE